MTTLKELREAQENLDHARSVADYLQEQLKTLRSSTSLDELAKWIAPPSSRYRLSFGERTPAVCTPVERAYTREGDPELRLLCFPDTNLDLGLLLTNRLCSLGVIPGVTFKAFPHASVLIASSSNAKSEHLAGLVRKHKLRGVVVGIQHDERHEHALYYCDEPALLGLVDIEDEHCSYRLRQSQRDVRQVDWSLFPFLTPNSNP